MNAATPIPPVISFISETAPFNEEQRAWLNGFFAGMLAPQGAPTALATTGNAALVPAALDDGAPWHDASMPLDERLKLAEGKPLPRRMMAAMAQQDCGQCGYLCETYAAAIAGGKEARLNLCAPGGKETTRTLKSLATELGAQPLPSADNAARDVHETALPAPAWTRDNPALVKLTARHRLNRQGSEKETWHVEFDIAQSGLDYAVGDSFGIFAENDQGLVTDLLGAVGGTPQDMIGERHASDMLARDVCLGAAPDSLFELLTYHTGGEMRRKARALAAGEDPDGDAATLDVLAAIEKFGRPRIAPEVLIEALEPLQPRLYSISSSPRATPGRLSLTVDTVRYGINGRTRLGVASTFLATRLDQATPLRAYVQKAHGFALPSDPATPVIMVGPGTGIAPFRAFLWDRMASKSLGKNWLFFGHQRSDCDFFYEDELAGMRASGHLSRLTLAWSRDAAEKIYVQDRMREVGADLFSWLEEGAHFYICGDAKRMARDVEHALVDVVASYGNRSSADAQAYVAALKKAGRYQADVY